MYREGAAGSVIAPTRSDEIFATRVVSFWENLSLVGLGAQSRLGYPNPLWLVTPARYRIFTSSPVPPASTVHGTHLERDIRSW